MFLGSTVRGLPCTTLGSSGAVTLDRSKGETFEITPTAAVTLTVSNDLDNDAFQVRVMASAFGVTWFAGCKWPGGTPPTPPTAAGHRTVYGFRRRASGDYDTFTSAEMG